MRLELISHPLCPFVHRAAAMLREKGVTYDARQVDLKAKPDWFLALSPRGKVPVLVADGVTLFESAAIVEFLDETHPPHIVPSDPYERARQRAWIEVANDLFVAHYKLYTIGALGELAAAQDALGAVLARFEPELRGDFFAGDAIGIVDFAVAPALFRIRMLERLLDRDLIGPLPRVGRWADRLANRPSVAQSVVHDFAAQYRTSVASRGVLLAS